MWKAEGREVASAESNRKIVEAASAPDDARDGPWRNTYRSPLYVPDRHRSAPVDAKLLPELKAVRFSEAGASFASKHTPQEIEDTLKPFTLLRRDGGHWEKKIYERLDAKLVKWHTDCKGFTAGGSSGGSKGVQFSGDIEWEIESIRLIYDETRMDKFHAIGRDENGKRVEEFDAFLAFHGTQLANFRLIIENNFKVDGKGGWYGNGGYFTSNLVYSQHYIGGMEKTVRFPSVAKIKENKGLTLPKQGNTVFIVGAMIKPGKCHVIPKDPSVKGAYTGAEKDKGKVADVDSHLAYVSPENETNPYSSMGYRPVESRDKAFAEEFVIFDKDRVLPRYIIGLKRVDRRWFLSRCMGKLSGWVCK